MEPITMQEIGLAMKRHGGSFVQALGECFIRADLTNAAKLEAAFREYFAQYIAWASHDRSQS